MEGLGSQLCDYLVRQVITHVENSTAPRMAAFLDYVKANIEKDSKFIMCYACDTPAKRDSETNISCTDKQCECNQTENANDPCVCLVTCGRAWCIPLNCSVCNKKNLCGCQEHGCDQQNCKKCMCRDCSDSLYCSSCHSVFCVEHGNMKSCVWDTWNDLKRLVNICSKCSKDRVKGNNLNCYKCNKSFSRFDLLVKTLEGKSFSGVPVCRNCY